MHKVRVRFFASISLSAILLRHFILTDFFSPSFHCHFFISFLSSLSVRHHSFIIDSSSLNFCHWILSPFLRSHSFIAVLFSPVSRHLVIVAISLSPFFITFPLYHVLVTIAWSSFLCPQFCPIVPSLPYVHLCFTFATFLSHFRNHHFIVRVSFVAALLLRVPARHKLIAKSSRPFLGLHFLETLPSWHCLCPLVLGSVSSPQFTFRSYQFISCRHNLPSPSIPLFLVRPVANVLRIFWSPICRQHLLSPFLVAMSCRHSSSSYLVTVFIIISRHHYL